MAKNKNSDLRDHLFEVLESLKDNEDPMNLERAKAVCEVAQVIINSAKVDVEMAKAVGSLNHSNLFFGITEESRELPRIEQRKGTAS